ncbi:MAG: lipopolysaccharide transport periplasmic protein LptA [Desulfobacterales bacterium]|nr:lipopolysaccharide transport periplasmic protein LptA [Desulfobacterales bacterium]
MDCYIRLPEFTFPTRYSLTLSFFIIFFFSSFAFTQEMNPSKDKVKEIIHVTADSLSSDSDAKFAEFIGNVKATQGDFIIKSDRLKIYYKDSAESKAAPGTTESIEKIVATGNVEIKSEEGMGLAQQAEYDTKTMIVVLTGENSKVFDQKNSVTGSRITIYRNDGRVKVEGDKNKKVNAILYPKEKTPAKEEAVKKEKERVVLKEEKAPVVQAKADKLPPVAPVNVVYAPAVIEKAKLKTASGGKVAPGSLRKSMGMAVFENRTVYTLVDFQETLRNHLAGALQRNCSGLIIMKDDDENYPSDFEKLPRLSSGGIDSFKLCETGRKLGLTAIMTGSITDIKTSDESRGILLWKDSYPAVSLTVHVDVLDVETGTKLLAESFTYKKYSDEIEMESIKSGKIESAFLKEAFGHIAGEAGKKVCEIMRRESWKGYVSSVSGDKIAISSGSNMGVATGKAFEVFGNSLIVGMHGQRFLVPGAKTGEVKITGVFDDSAEASIVSGDSIREGSTVRPK